MKMSHLILGSLIALASFYANHAQAKSYDLPLPVLEYKNGTKVIAINHLLPDHEGIINEILMRSHLGAGDRPQENVFSVVRNGRVEFNSRKDLKTLSEPVLLTLASTRICDINVFGECVIYNRNSNDDLHILVIGSRMYHDGTVEFIQSTFNSRITRATDGFLYRLAVELKDDVRSPRVIFTRANHSL